MSAASWTPLALPRSLSAHREPDWPRTLRLNTLTKANKEQDSGAQVFPGWGGPMGAVVMTDFVCVRVRVCVHVCVCVCVQAPLLLDSWLG